MTRTQENAVLARDVGKTIKWESQESKKLDVNVGDSLEVNQAGEINVKKSALPKVADKDARTGDVVIHNPDGSDVVLEAPRVTIGANEHWFIDGVDTGKPSRGLRGQQGDQGRQGIQGNSAYEVAKANGFNGTEAQWLESLKGEKGDRGERGLQGIQGIRGEKGEQGIQGLKGDTGAKGAKGDKGDPLRFTDLTPQQKQELKGEKGDAGQLDCAAISNLPLASWKQGTSILASQDGECKRLVPLQNLFQEIGVAMYANKLSGLTKETYHVVVTVTNSGEAANTLTDLVITKPQLGNYTIQNYTNSASTGARVEKVNDLTYKIHNLGSGGTAKVEFDVIPNAAGTFQFGASVNPNTVLDQQTNNNRATITLSATTLSSNVEALVDCPHITVKDKRTNKPLMMGHSYKDDRCNVFEGSMVNRILVLTGASTVMVFKDPYNNNVVQGFTRDYAKTARLYQSGVGERGELTYGFSVRPVDSTWYTFNQQTGELKFLQDSTSFVVAVRPAGADCKWQHFKITKLFNTTKRSDLYTVTGLPANQVESIVTRDINGYGAGSTTSVTYNIVDGEQELFPNVVRWGNSHSHTYTNVAEKNSVNITLNRGVTKNFTIQRASGVTPVETQGALNVTTAEDGKRYNVTTTTAISQTDRVTMGTPVVNIKVV